MDIIDEDIKALKANLSALEEVVDHNEGIMTQIGSETTVNTMKAKKIEAKMNIPTYLYKSQSTIKE